MASNKARGGMIGRSLQERHGLAALDSERAVALLRPILESHGKPIVEVRAKDPRMIACVVADADEASVRLCRRLGFELRPGGVGVVGILGDDAVRLFPVLAGERAAWATTPSAARETKVILVAEGGTAFLSVEADGGRVTVTAV